MVIWWLQEIFDLALTREDEVNIAVANTHDKSLKPAVLEAIVHVFYCNVQYNHNFPEE